jgi:hypothetical protein
MPDDFKEGLIFLLGREGLLLLLLEGLLELRVGDLDVLVLGLALDPLGLDEELEHLVAQPLVLLLALRLELRRRRLRLALRGLGRGRLLGRHALG